MKTIIATSVMTAFLITGALAQRQGEEYLGLPGDNLNLYAVMQLFQESQTLEEFERNLNDENSRINNLDLNGDNRIDYISVYDNVRGNVHNIVLQVAITAREKQDVAVFTVERENNGNVWLQLTGDEALYGRNYIIEPIIGYAAATPNPGYTGNATTINGQRVVAGNTNVTVIAVTTWPITTYIYGPRYVVWRSPWYWGYYPPYWRTWTPYYYHYYYGYHYHWNDRYYAYYHRTYDHRHDYWNRYYYRPQRTYSRVVTRNISSGHYKVTYSRPDERSRGEALYMSTHGNRRQDNSPIDNSRRNTAPPPTNNRVNTNNSGNTDRRNSSATTTRTETRQSSGSSAATSANRRNNAVSQSPASNQTNASERRTTTTQSSNANPSTNSARSSSERTTQTKATTPARSSEKATNSNTSTSRTTRARTESSSSSSKSNSSSNSSSSGSETNSRSGETTRSSSGRR